MKRDDPKGLCIEFREKGADDWTLYGEYGGTQRRTVDKEAARLRQVGYEVRIQALMFDPRHPSEIRRRA